MKGKQNGDSVPDSPKLYASLIRTVVEQFSLNIHGIHGISHWARVFENGRRLAKITGADPEVVELFAILHDAKRHKEWHDRGHGHRSAEYAKRLKDVDFTLSNGQFDLLYTACAGHELGTTEGNITVQTCWDADRLDLGRVLIAPDPARLCTEAAKSTAICQWANSRSTRFMIPSLVSSEWDYPIISCNGILEKVWLWLLRVRRAFSNRRLLL